MTSLKWVEENYKEGEILKVAPKTQVRIIERDCTDFSDLQEVENFFWDEYGLSATDVKIDVGGWDQPGTFRAEIEVPLSKEKRLQIGKKKLRDWQKRNRLSCRKRKKKSVNMNDSRKSLKERIDGPLVGTGE